MRFLKPWTQSERVATRSCCLPSIVVDASAIVELLIQSDRADFVRQAISGLDMIAPDFLNVEVLSALRRLQHLEVALPARITQAVADLQTAPITRWPTTPLISMIWDLRMNLSAYDASYVALARAHACQLVTGDARLARAPGMKAVTTLV